MKLIRTMRTDLDPVEADLCRRRICVDDGAGDPPAGGGAGDPYGNFGAGAQADPLADAPPSDDWRDAITDADLRKVADRFASPVDAVKAVSDLRKRESNSIRLPGDNASPDEIAAYRRAIGVPMTPDGYAFAPPGGRELTEAERAIRAETGELFLANGLTVDQAAGLTRWWNETTAAAEQNLLDADREFAERTEAQLRKDWPGEEYEINRELANRAATELFGDDYDEVRHLQGRDERFILDHPALVRAFALFGREMNEGNLGGAMTGSAFANLNDQISDARNKAQAASSRGDRAEANRWSNAERALIERRDGVQPVVGAAGRVA